MGARFTLLTASLLLVAACDSSASMPPAKEPPLPSRPADPKPLPTATAPTPPPTPTPTPTTPPPGPQVAKPATTDAAHDQPGIGQDKIANGVKPLVPKLQACYDEGRKSDGNLAGLVKVRFTITPAGDVVNVVDDHSSIPNNEVIKCVIGLFQSLKYPPFEGKAVTTVYPIDFRAPPPSPERVPPSAD